MTKLLFLNFFSKSNGIEIIFSLSLFIRLVAMSQRCRLCWCREMENVDIITHPGFSHKRQRVGVRLNLSCLVSAVVYRSTCASVGAQLRSITMMLSMKEILLEKGLSSPSTERRKVRAKIKTKCEGKKYYRG